jgi:hypothetical protein
MSKQSDPTGFAKFVPGFDFLQKLAQGGSASLASWVAPTLDAQALDKRIDELKAVQFWLDQNAAALKATIQALEVQKMTLATLKTMNVPMPGAAWPQATAPAPAKPAAAPAPGPKPKPARKPRPAAAASQAASTASSGAPAMPDPMQFWGALTQQFQQIASQAMKDVATRSAPPAAKKSDAAPAPARKAPPRSRKPA